MKIENMAKQIVSNYTNEARRKRTMLFLGPSGIGKSDSMREASEVLSAQYKCAFPVLDKRLSQMEPPDFGGVPSVVEGKTVKNTPDWWPTDPDSRGIVLLDEITSAPPVMQAAGYEVCLDRSMGGMPLPEGWMVVAAGNRASDRGVNYPLAMPLLARMTVINVESSLDGFLEYCATHSVRPEVMAFVKSQAQYLNERDETVNPKMNELPSGKPFSNQRSWTTAVQHYLDEPAEDRLELIRGAVGDRAATDFEAFLRIWETMPSIDGAFANPTKHKLPTSAAEKYAVSVGISARLTNKNFGTVLPYLDRMAAEHRALCIKLAYKRSADIAECEAFATFVAANPELWKHGA